MTDKPYTAKPEHFWRPDANVDAARKLPEWVEFHRVCGRQSLCFDHIERTGKHSGPYRCHAFRTQRNGENWVFVDLGHGEGRTVVDALAAAYRQSGVTVNGAEEMLTRGLSGKPVVAAAATEVIGDPLADDAFDELFG